MCLQSHRYNESNKKLLRISLKFSINTEKGSTWYNNTNWLLTGVRYWHGINRDVFQERVTAIELPNNNLNGVISPLVCQLEERSLLDLGWNNLTGQIPPVMRE